MLYLYLATKNMQTYILAYFGIFRQKDELIRVGIAILQIFFEKKAYF